MVGTMSYDPKERLHRCDVCRRAMNPTDSLTEMRKPGEAQAMGVCPSSGCWRTANERGYWSRYQERPE